VGLALEADLTLPGRNAGMNLAFLICRTDCLCRIFDPLSTCMTPSSTFSIPVESLGLLGTLRNLKLHISERRAMARLIFTTTLVMCRRINPAGPLRDVNAGCMGCTRGYQNLFRSGIACAVSSGACHFKSNLRRDSRASHRRVVGLSYCLGAGGT